MYMKADHHTGDENQCPATVNDTIVLVDGTERYIVTSEKWLTMPMYMQAMSIDSTGVVVTKLGIGV